MPGLNFKATIESENIPLTWYQFQLGWKPEKLVRIKA